MGGHGSSSRDYVEGDRLGPQSREAKGPSLELLPPEGVPWWSVLGFKAKSLKHHQNAMLWTPQLPLPKGPGWRRVCFFLYGT